jgi:multisubunit Na+/H+ antiporter MnhF subunit
MAEQNFANHTKWVPAFHFFVLPVVLLNFGWSIYRLVHGRHWMDGTVGVLTAAALVLLTFYARLFALTVQDRVIRLEERLRYERLLPEDLKARIPEFTRAQFVSLRFASDAELPALARKVLSDNLTERKAIKQLVQHWRADHLRA